ncbi:MAG: tetratricopeptide repeat protein [Verrucomicrobiota bacterium]
MRLATVIVQIFLLNSFVPSEAAEITFNQDIAPIIYENCAVCHRPEGSAPFSFHDYRSVSRRSRQIAEVIESGFMPPWKPDSGYGPHFKGDRSLSSQQIATLLAWLGNGSPEGNTPPPSPPEFSSAWTLGEPDLIVSPSEAYLLPPEGNDVFRTLVIPIKLASPKYVRAVEFLPGNAKVVHHAVLQIDRTSSSLQKDLISPEPGFDGMDMAGAVNPDGHFIGWTTGQTPYQAHPGTAWKLSPNSHLVVQLHLLPSGKEEPVRPEIGFHFSDEPPTRATFVLLLKDSKIDIPAEESNYLVQQSFTLPVDVEVLRLYPHAHYLGKDLQVYAELPNGEQQGLIRISEWDFSWQADYELSEPLPLPKGSNIVMRYTYDNSSQNFRNPNYPPKRIQYGWNSSDEMGEISIQVIVKNQADLQTLQSTYFEYKIAGEPNNPYLRNSLGLSLARSGKAAKAAAHYRRAIELKPDFAAAHNNLGVLYASNGLHSLAEKSFARAIEQLPDYAEALHNNAGVLLERGEIAEAHRLFSLAIEKQPDLNKTRIALAKIDLSQGRFKQAIEHLTAVERSDFDLVSTKTLLAAAFISSGESEAAIVRYQEILQQEPNSFDARYGLGIAHFNLNSYEQAQEHFLAAIRRNPNSIKATAQVSRVLLRLDQPEKAAKFFAQAKALADSQDQPISRLDRYFTTPEERTFANELNGDSLAPSASIQ